MALTQVKTDGIANGAVTTQQLAPGAAGGPKITQIQITNAGGTVLDDTAISLSGGYIKITGTGFAAGAQVIVNNIPATSTTFTSTTVLNAQVGAQSAGTYVVYVVNTDGGVAIAVNGLTYSSEPTWVTGSTLPAGVTGIAISIQLNATGDAPVIYALQAGSTLPTGLTLTSGGLLSGTVTVGAETTYSFTVVATDAEAQDSPRTFSITITVGDPYFYLTTLLLPGNGTNNGTNNTFIDSSTNNYTITRNGNTTQGTYTPFSLTGWSNYFDGTGDYLSIADNAALDLGTGDFTIECWVYPITGISNVDGVIGKRSQSTFTGGDWRIAYISASTAFGIACGSNNTDRLTPAITLNAWNHIAFVRSSGTLSCYANGVRGANLSWTDNLDNTEALLIGLNVAGFDFPGYISNVRIVKGTGVYSGATYTVPIAPLTAIANTSLLTCQSNRFKDNSTNNFAITRNGDVSVQSFSPFAPGTSYNTNAVGGSGYFDGTGDYLQITGNTNNALGAGDFTIEGWFFSTGTTGQGGSGEQGIIGSGITTSSRWTVRLQNSPTKIMSWWLNGPANNVTGSTPILQNTWYHFALVRSGSSSNNVKLYLNGVLESQGTNTYTVPTDDIVIGRTYTNLDGEYWNGYISSLRIVKGTAVYTTNFTPPTAPVTAIANTAVLCNFTNGQIIDATSKNDLETIADAKISTAQSKWGGSSIYFDGTGDYLVTPSTAVNTLAGDFTVEMWVYRSAGNNFFFTLGDSFGSTGFDLYIGNTGANLRLYSGNSVVIDSAISSINFPTSTWTHLALVRSSGSVRLYVAGVQAGSAWASSAVFSGRVYVGAEFYNGGITGTCNGYMDDVRVTNGIARYTTNFTPPTSAFPTL